MYMWHFFHNGKGWWKALVLYVVYKRNIFCLTGWNYDPCLFCYSKEYCDVMFLERGLIKWLFSVVGSLQKHLLSRNFHFTWVETKHTEQRASEWAYLPKNQRETIFCLFPYRRGDYGARWRLWIGGQKAYLLCLPTQRDSVCALVSGSTLTDSV